MVPAKMFSFKPTAHQRRSTTFESCVIQPLTFFSFFFAWKRYLTHSSLFMICLLAIFNAGIIQSYSCINCALLH